MKKLILSICVFLVIFMLSACADEGKNVFIEVPDANFKSYLLENFDTNKDGLISLSEARAVKKIDCSNRNIENLEGIEHFVNLERLICNDNKLDELDLRYNKKIKWLVCTNNNDQLQVYFAMSSPLRNKKFAMPNNNDAPDVATLVKPFDESKVVFDWGKTDFIICFNE